jgi:hypothetical protein
MSTITLSGLLSSSYAGFTGSQGGIGYTGSAGITLSNFPYDIRFAFVSAPTSSQIIDTVLIARGITFSSNLSGSLGRVAINPTSTFVMELKANDVTIGSISVSTSGVFTFSTVDGTSKIIAAGTVLTLHAPVTPNAAISNLTMTIYGSEN